MNALGMLFRTIGRYMYLARKNPLKAGYIMWQIRGCTGPKLIQSGEPEYVVQRAS